ncbi:MAG: 16S rRNA (cytosine(1402)-N(4))-methyltransferase [Candidatus Chisholmbacteria bacterium RIFCSPLOWO2_01_FULL_50_28]|uniref:Ribosomal RNA small subunit methyltransferase H n=1 Tax=Candidatus Chisholmbacteria bacterium RIFCSPHIGHO2_01_FULL_52_32 TaxID=1797591 RepID=A0A1G1VT02_9BACT|nr:MAG: 16S rRNA (cytosine(1402)-N(4))-methyltransferase [Candidatus Chisholmbacteria bacterium RIFCSPHIGHO2_01_FULL_52_32]OGY20174.1 MAG: 16S rRNA (cytosine(1402)-N(4))-methyltransferase [Candidatus Chisholmbacteria bacterium RIFCSPLOWO2_01_FULL_50_28]
MHLPVLIKEAIEALHIQKGRKYIDATVGEGGHALEIVKRGGRLLAIDVDPKAVERARKRIEETREKERDGGQAGEPSFAVGNFRNIARIAKDKGFNRVSGILFDLGVSSVQLEGNGKGLSFTNDSPLDMRLDPDLPRTAADLVKTLSQEELYEIFTRNAQEDLARPISQALVIARRIKPIYSTRQLAEVVASVAKRRSRLHPATKVFLALRIEVNDEIKALKEGLTQAIGLLEKKGRLVVISFHETEDRIVKQLFKKIHKENKILLLTKKPIVPGSDEQGANPRARSAKLRIAERV